MVSEKPKMCSIAGKLTPNKLTERENGFTFNVTYLVNRSLKDFCMFAEKNDSKFTVTELKSAYNYLLAQALNALHSGSIVEFGFANSSLGVEGAFIGPKA